MENNKYLKVMFGTKSGASEFEYKLNEVNIANVWNPNETEPDKMGGFNFSTENIGSCKVIEKCGGKFENIAIEEETGLPVKRYWIKIGNGKEDEIRRFKNKI